MTILAADGWKERLQVGWNVGFRMNLVMFCCCLHGSVCLEVLVVKQNILKAENGGVAG